MAGSTTTADPRVIPPFPLGLDAAVVVSPTSDPPATWQCSVRSSDDDAPQGDLLVVEGAAEALVDTLRHTVTVPAEGFRVVRLVPPPEASGERPLHQDAQTSTTVVGERVVVTWIHQLRNVDTPSPVTCAHLAERRFLGVPVTHGVLTWQTPQGREVPCAVATGYLPNSRTGWEWCPDLVAQAIGVRTPTRGIDAAGLRTASGTGSIPLPDPWVDDFLERIGRLVAKLHVALATPSSIIPDPIQRRGPATLESWHSTAVGHWNRLEQQHRLDDPDAASEDRASLEELRRDIDRLAQRVAGMSADPLSAASSSEVVVQRVHGNLHLGQFIRWHGGLAISDTGHDSSPGTDQDPLADSPLTRPAARDLAQLLVSLDDVIQITERRSTADISAALRSWRAQARDRLVEAYRKELAHADAGDLFDEDLLPAFEAEHRCFRLLSPQDVPAGRN